MADEQVEFKYKAEYSKSNRASCKGCKTKIEKDVLRLAVLVQSSHFDGKVPMWYHHMCFFGKQKPTDVGDIEGFESLTWDDQKKVRQKIAEKMGGAPSGKADKGDKKATKRALKTAASKDFCVEYAKSSRAMCRGCEIKISKGEVRISKKDFESEDARRYGGKDLWHHITCFANLRNELEFFECGDSLPGFVTLSKEDQATVKSALPKSDKPKVKEEKVKEEGEPDVKKVKKEEKNDDKVMKKQNSKLMKYRDILKDLKRPELKELLEYNGQDDNSISEIRVDHLADCMAFGALAACDVCKDGQFKFKSGVGYQCQGDLDQWTKCLKISRAPKRTPFKIPKDIAEEHPELESYKCKVEDRVIAFRDLPATSAVKTENSDQVDSGPKVSRFAPLRNLYFFFIGKLGKSKEELKASIVKLGGTVQNKFDPSLLTAVISNEDEVEKWSKHMEEAEIAGIHVVPIKFIEEAAKEQGDISELITKLSISTWGTNLKARINAANLKSAALKSEKTKSIYTKSVPTRQTLKIKNGLAVDPDSGMEDVASVYADKKLGPYNVVLSRTEIQSGRNSYYKMQLLTSDHSKNKFYLFRSWGRIGTTIGGTKTDSYSSLDSAKNDFLFHYKDKTGHDYEHKSDAAKIPGLYYPVEVAYGDEIDSIQMDKSDVPSKLHGSVQELIKTIFDMELMKKVMMEFELDLEKMPLGKLSKKQIQKAFSVLSELQMKDGDIKPAAVVGATNRFYTLIPHSFGVGNPPLLDNKEIISSKVEMLESLLEMETAYNILKESNVDSDGTIHPIDKHYSKLNTEIEVVEKASEEYLLIEKYVQNTHGETHTMYKLEIDQLYKIKRQGEEKRFKPFKKLHNRKLLWHGSRLTNFVGILSQGLRIAPPEAPVTGYMFGKGIYFADMVTKSANYCMTSRQSNTGLLLLCEVALGEMYERTHAEYVEKLPSGKHSTKGIGHMTPNPAHTVTLEDGLEVPVGKGIKIVDSSKTSLLYNEYIVYDPAQVKARYLLKTKFNYSY